jgi:hypothetical protein
MERIALDVAVIVAGVAAIGWVNWYFLYLGRAVGDRNDHERS